MSDSLMQAEVQLALIPSSAMDAVFFEGLERKGEFTGERLWKQRPETYRQIVSLSAEGHGQIKIGEMLGVSPNTVRQVQRREKSAIDILKKAAAETAMSVTGLCFEEMYRRMCDPVERAKISFRDLAIGGAVAADKSAQLNGDIAGRVDLTVQLEAGPAAFQEFMRAVAGGTGLGGNGAGQKGSAGLGASGGSAPGAPGGQGKAEVVIDLPGTPDMQSGGK